VNDLLYDISQVLLVLTALVTLVRLWRGPTIFDRILCIDMLALAVVGYLLLESYGSVHRFYTDAALALALFAFVSTVAFGVLLRRGEYPDE
jgi:multicomponent Na+:H+ antiporter subunit F